MVEGGGEKKAKSCLVWAPPPSRFGAMSGDTLGARGSPNDRRDIIATLTPLYRAVDMLKQNKQGISRPPYSRIQHG